MYGMGGNNSGVELIVRAESRFSASEVVEPAVRPLASDKYKGSLAQEVDSIFRRLNELYPAWLKLHQKKDHVVGEIVETVRISEKAFFIGSLEYATQSNLPSYGDINPDVVRRLIDIAKCGDFDFSTLKSLGTYYVEKRGEEKARKVIPNYFVCSILENLTNIAKNDAVFKAVKPVLDYHMRISIEEPYRQIIPNDFLVPKQSNS